MTPTNKLGFLWVPGGAPPRGRTARRVMAKEGVIGLWRGNTPNVLKVIPRSALQFAVFYNMKV